MNEATIPWRAMMGVAFSRLFLSPEAFWSMTLHEFSAAVQVAERSHAFTKPDREKLSEMLAAFPDENRNVSL